MPTGTDRLAVQGAEAVHGAPGPHSSEGGSAAQPVVVGGRDVNPVLPDLQIFKVKPEIWIFMWNLLVFKHWQPI